ncbi:hypothetical protein BH10PSE12_BH10PSE12_19000 [soil metagenome]
MTVRDGLIVTLPDAADADPLWIRVGDGVAVQSGTGTRWLESSGLSALPSDCLVMLVPPAGLTVLHWIDYPDMPARQGRAAARLAALAGSIGPADGLVAAANDNIDPARPHVVAIAARPDMQHWLLWAQHHGLDPDLVVPAALLLPEPEQGHVSGIIGGASIVRGRDVGMPADDAMIAAIAGEGAVVRLGAESIAIAAIAALDDAPLNMRQGDFAKRTRRTVDRQQVARIAVWCGFIALASLLITLIAITRYHAAASRLDTETLALAQTVLPNADDPERVEVDIDARLAERGAGAYMFTGTAAGLFSAMQAAPGVSLSRLSRSADGMLSATLAATKAEDINMVLLALQSAGFTITATSSSDSSGRVLADITVRP